MLSILLVFVTLPLAIILGAVLLLGFLKAVIEGLAG